MFMLLGLLSPVDYAVVLVVLAALVAPGLFFAGRQTDTAEYCLGSRSLGWAPLGLSLTAIVAGSLPFTSLPAQAYEFGLKCWIIPASFWLILPIVVYLLIPIQRGLSLESVYAYLQQRFDVRVRLAASSIYVVWRLLWLAAVICISCKTILVASGWDVPVWVLNVLLGAVATWYAAVGGMKAVVWTGLMQTLVMLLGVAVIIGGIWLSTAGGPARVAEVADELGRLQAADAGFAWNESWTIWGAWPHWLLASLFFCTADQITVQRFLCAKDVNTARTSYFAGTLALSLLLSGMIYIGLCLLAFYHDRPHDLRPEWVVNLDGVTREPMLDKDGRPLLDPTNRAHQITPENLDRLIAERRLLRPNDKLPFTSADDLVDPSTGRILVEKLALFRPGERREVILRRGASEQMLPQFIAAHLSWGAAGVALAALLAAAWALFAAGVHAISTLLVVDFHRHVGFGQRWLASRWSQPATDLTAADELWLARQLTVVVGIAVTALAIFASVLAEAMGMLVAVTNHLGAPLLAIFLLGMLTRRTTAAAALAVTTGGVLVTLALCIFHLLAATGVVSTRYAFVQIWIFTISFAFTFGIGYLLSFVVGRRKAHRDLRGLVAGCGTLGVRANEEELPIINVPEQTTDPLSG
jgi:Na+/proline symporter